jgi:hypothetical protein
VIAEFLERSHQPRFGVAIFTAFLRFFMAAHWPPMMFLALAVLAVAIGRPTAIERPELWWGSAALWIVVEIFVADRMEDHIYLFTAWLVALAHSLRATDDEGFLARISWQARVLVGTTFAVAVAWKLYFAQYVTGTALWLYLVVDSRFGPLRWAVGLSDGDVRDARSDIRALLEGSADSVTLEASSSVVWRIVAVAVATLLVETLIAVAHFAPDNSRMARLRVPLVAVFGVATYSVVPVVPFSALLAVLAMAAARWRPEVMWIFPVMLTVSMVRFVSLILV